MNTQLAHAIASDDVVLSTEALHRFVYTCPQAILMTSAEGQVQLLSAGAVALLAPFCADGSLDDLFALLTRYEPRFRARLREAILGPSRRLDGLRVEIPGGAPGGSAWIEVSAVAFDGGYSLACRDITAIVEQEAREAARFAEEAHQRGKSEMAAAVLHDLGNALTGIGGRAVEVRALCGDPSIAQNLGRATAFLKPHVAALDGLLGAGRGKALLDLLGVMTCTAERSRAGALASLEKLTAYIAHAQDLLTIQRTYAGSGSDVTRQRVSIERLLTDVHAMTDASVEKRGGILTLATVPLPLVRVDRSKLMQVLLNLVKNAAEALDELPAGRHPEVTLSAARGEDGAVVLAVRDTGPGFSAAVGARVFEDGFSTKARGSGIGLGACRRIVESFGGHLTLTSDGPGTGALARIVLPLEVIVDDAP